MAYFDRVDVYALEQDLEVPKRAQDEGWRDRPASGDTTIDDAQRAIIGTINELLNAARSRGEEALKEIAVKLGTINLGATLNLLYAAVTN